MAQIRDDETLTPILRLEFDAAALLKDHPPKLRHRNKKAIYTLSLRGEAHGTIGFTRWRERRLPEAFPATAPAIESRDGVFDYAPPADGAMEWHLNFADPALFFAYGGSLFAQDEIQVAEHPLLASLREALLARGADVDTIDRDRPTPVLVTGVERRCAIDARGIYGQAFAAASVADVEKATRVLQPPTVSNIIAMAAPAGRSGRYRREDIELILATAYTAFSAAKDESQHLSPGAKVVIHTGFWGCGAFGGNRQLTPLLQLAAARLAGIDKVVFHAGGNVESFEKARQLLESTLPIEPGLSTAEWVHDVYGYGFEWGVSDGN